MIFTECCLKSSPMDESNHEYYTCKHVNCPLALFTLSNDCWINVFQNTKQGLQFVLWCRTVSWNSSSSFSLNNKKSDRRWSKFPSWLPIFFFKYSAYYTKISASTQLLTLVSMTKDTSSDIEQTGLGDLNLNQIICICLLLLGWL